MSFLPARTLARRAQQIRLLVLDVDGVLTDGGMYYGPRGELLKRFDTRDGQGIALARGAGIEIALLTREKTAFAKARADKLALRHCIIGATTKDRALRSLIKAVGVASTQTAYVGDDEADRPCIPLVSLFFMPADGWLARSHGIHVVTERGGGRGAVRQVIRYLLESRH